MRTFTNGPWKAIFGNDKMDAFPAHIIGASGHPIAYVLKPDPSAGGDYGENARCLAAARELLGICQMVDAAYSGPPSCLHKDMSHAIMLLREKVAHVLGGQPYQDEDDKNPQ